MQFIRVKAQNFKSFESVDIDLKDNGFVKIDGVNNTDSFSKSVGSGKSTIADMISYALTGETVKGNSSMSDIRNLYSNGKCSVQVDFVCGDDCYSIIRGEAGLRLVENGVDISKHLRKETQQLIEEKFPYFTPTFLGATVIIGQNMPNSFTNNKPSARKQILEELTNSSFMIEEVKQLLADRKMDWTSELNDLNSELSVVRAKRESNIAALDRASNKLNNLRDAGELRKLISALENSIMELDYSISDCGNSINKHTKKLLFSKDLIKSLSDTLVCEKDKHSQWMLDSLSNFMAEKTRLSNGVARLTSEGNANKRAQQNLLKRISDLVNTPTVCPTCKQPLPDAHKIDTSAEEAELKSLVDELLVIDAALNIATADLNAVSSKIDSFKSENATNDVIKQLSEDIKRVESDAVSIESEIQKLNDFMSSLRAESSAQNRSLVGLQVELSELEAVKKSCESEIDRVNSENSAYDSRISELAGLIDEKSARLNVLNQVVSFASRDFRTILLSNIIKRLDSYAKSYCMRMLGTSDIDFRDDGNNISIAFRGRDFGVLSGGESQIVKMCITLALKRTLEDLVGFTTNIMFFDEILDNCDQSTAQQLIELVSGLELSSTFFISHHDDVYLPIDKTWVVTKTNNISRLSF